MGIMHKLFYAGFLFISTLIITAYTTGLDPVIVPRYSNGVIGEHSTFQCIVEYNEFITISWKINGQIYFEYYPENVNNYAITPFNTCNRNGSTCISTLSILLTINFPHNSTITCEASLRFDMKSFDATLVIPGHDHGQEIIVSASPNNVDAIVGRFADYTCTATCYTQAKIQIDWELTGWSCDNEKITIYPSYEQVSCLNELSCVSKLHLLVLNTFPYNSVIKCNVTASSSQILTDIKGQSTVTLNSGKGSNCTDTSTGSSTTTPNKTAYIAIPAAVVFIALIGATVIIIATAYYNCFKRRRVHQVNGRQRRQNNGADNVQCDGDDSDGEGDEDFRQLIPCVPHVVNYRIHPPPHVHQLRPYIPQD